MSISDFRASLKKDTRFCTQMVNIYAWLL